jgi:uncharacterized repeat protein (TIGR03803 family)
MMKKFALQSCAAGAIVMAFYIPAHAQINVLYDFEKGAKGGHTPMSHLVLDKTNGSLYGTAEKGGKYGFGAIFQLKKNHYGEWRETELYSFKGHGDGAYPKAGLVMDSTGALLGTTEVGGSYNDGIIFRLVQSGYRWYEQILHDFQGSGYDGTHPYSDLIQNQTTGVYYGTTYDGYTNNCGAVYELSEGGNNKWTEQVLYALSSAGGCNSQAALRQD